MTTENANQGIRIAPPTWVGVLPIITLGLTDCTEVGKRIAKEQLLTMAKLADERNAMVDAEEKAKAAGSDPLTVLRETLEFFRVLNGRDAFDEIANPTIALARSMTGV